MVKIGFEIECIPVVYIKGFAVSALRITYLRTYVGVYVILTFCSCLEIIEFVLETLFAAIPMVFRTRDNVKNVF